MVAQRRQVDGDNRAALRRRAPVFVERVALDPRGHDEERRHSDDGAGERCEIGER